MKANIVGIGKLTLACVTMAGTTTSINRLFNGICGRRSTLEKVGGAIFGATCGFWAAAKATAVIDTIIEGLVREVDEELEDEPAEPEKQVVVIYDGVKYCQGADGKLEPIEEVGA